VIKSEFWI